MMQREVLYEEVDAVDDVLLPWGPDEKERWRF